MSRGDRLLSLEVTIELCGDLGISRDDARQIHADAMDSSAVSLRKLMAHLRRVQAGKKAALAAKINGSYPREKRVAAIKQGKAGMTPEARSAASTKANLALSAEQRSARSRAANAKRSPQERTASARSAAKILHASLTPEQRSANASRASQKGNAAKTFEQRSAAAKKAAETMRTRRRDKLSQ